MANQALRRQIAQLRAEVEALRVRKEPVAPPAATLETIRETLRVSVAIGAIECDGKTLWWKGNRDAGRGSDDGRERARGTA